MRVREDLEAVRARHGDQRDAGRPRHVRSASAVGAETATTTGAPATAAFCTISTETRLVSSDDAARQDRRPRAAAADRACRARCGGRRPRASATRPSRGVQKPAPCTARVCWLSTCAAGSAASASAMSSAAIATSPAATRGQAGTAASRLSTPHSPQPVGPAMLPAALDQVARRDRARATCAARCRCPARRSRGSRSRRRRRRCPRSG